MSARDDLSNASSATGLAVAGDWNPPLPLLDGRHGPAFPVADAFPRDLEAIGDYVRAVAEHAQVPVDAPAMLLLPIAAVAIAQRLEIDPGGWQEVSALWSLVLMPSAERKSATLRAMTSPITSWEAEQAEQLAPVIARERIEREIAMRRLAVLRDRAAKGKSGAEDARREAIALAEVLDGQPLTTVPRLITTEPTPEALSALMADNEERSLVAAAEADAFDVMMGRYSEKGVPNLGTYLSGHSGDACRIDRRGRPPIIMHRPALSVAAIVQPEGVRGMFASRAARGRGLLARFLASAPASMLGRRRIHTVAVPLALSTTYERSIRWLLEQPRPADGPRVVTLDEAAQGLFDDFRAAIEPELARGGGLAEQRAWAGKLAGAVARIALALHGLRAAVVQSEERLFEPVGLPTMAAALAWTPYLIDHERIVAGVVGADPEAGTADRVLAWIEKTGAGRFTKRQAFTSLRSAALRRSTELDPALVLLFDHGYIRLLPVEPTTGPGRRASPVYVVNPLWKRGSLGGGVGE